MITLYGIGLSSNVSKIRYCLNYLGLDYEWKQVSPMKGETQTAEYRAIAPTGKIPAAEIDGVKLFESNAIIKYLASKNNSAIYPENLEKRAITDSWLDFTSIHIFAAIGRVVYNRAFAPMIGEESDERSLADGLRFMDKYYPILEKQLTDNKFVAGDEFTLADINLVAILDPLELVQLSIESYPNLTKWRNEMISQDWYQKCYPNYSEFLQEQMAKMA